MSATGLEVLDRTWQKTHEWVNELRDRLDWSSDRDTLRLLRVTLHQIRDRVHVNETAQLSAQLPIMIRGMFFEGWQPHLVPVPGRRAADFVTAVERHVGDVVEYRGQQDIVKVFKLLNARISPGQINDIRGNLPEDIRSLWPEP
ncbi:DUF2267 domain-containing protein [Aliiroseovarius sp. S1339]|uniref:DUF2267 domain-containing protein n=1 Tax=Aliiroseovarius sp. S1339 TaxID=2936990 RepID=UPI0020C0C135|nr:DUF2267 domain-containing protein [Aliiroseovarius sp. S1339]MCK8462445.1 DUF2267 domain-containing protein [Aliiroseovarius sp. S1339]